MKMKNKYYFGIVHETNGGMEYTIPFVFTTKGCEVEYVDKILKTWRGEGMEWNDEEGCYVTDNNFMRDGGSVKITSKDFAVLKKYLAVLTPKNTESEEV